MGTKFQLEVFELPDTTGDQVQLSASDLEEVRLTAFEKGYTAGWDDAVAAQEDEARKLRADLVRNLQDLSFTYHEARAHVLTAIEPLLRDMVAKVLPATARASLGQMVSETLQPLAEELANTPISVVVNPTNRQMVETMLTDIETLPLTIVEEESLGVGQVYLRTGDTETRIDLDSTIDAIGAAISAYFDTQKGASDDRSE